MSKRKDSTNGPMKRLRLVASLDKAKGELKASWEEWKTWAKLEERP